MPQSPARPRTLGAFQSPRERAYWTYRRHQAAADRLGWLLRHDPALGAGLPADDGTADFGKNPRLR